MLKQYKLVSIIYGGSGTKYAREMNELIQRRSEERRYPITSKIVMESVLTGDLLTSITDLFTRTEYCLAFLTADDCCIRGDERVYRLRQNVVLELGMAIYRLGREKCILLSDFDPARGDVELPSDLKGVDVKYFAPEEREQVFEAVLDKVLQLTSDQDRVIPQYDKLLERTAHYVNYTELFSACSALESREDAYLKSVLNHWQQECASFPFFEERCLYFLERIGFVSMFGRHDWVLDFLDQIKDLTDNYRQRDVVYCGKKQVDFLQNLTNVVLEFAQIKTHEGRSPAEEYAQLAQALARVPAEGSGVTNPLALTVYYDYLGLLNLLLYELTRETERLTEATRCFKLVIDRYADHTDLGLRIWPGFVKYNLARCYLLQYNLWQNPADAQPALDYFDDACRIRKRWLKQSRFHQVIRSALSYEYFICKLDEINARCVLQNKTPEDMAQEYLLLERELETYMLKSEQLERLVFIQNLLEQRRQGGGNGGPTSEDML